LPSLFITHYLFNEQAPVEIDYLNPIFVILYHLQKPLGVIILYIQTLLLIKNKE
jgi:hypothetical protein